MIYQVNVMEDIATGFVQFLKILELFKLVW